MDTSPYSLIGIEGSWLVVKVLKERVCCRWKAIGEALVEVCQVRRAYYLSPLGNHRPDLMAQPLLVTHIKPIPYCTERATRYEIHAYLALSVVKIAREDDF